MNYRLLAMLLLVLLTGCTTSSMQSFVGEDIQMVIADRGEPIDIVEESNGNRTYVFSGDEHWMIPDRGADDPAIEVDRREHANRECTVRFNTSWSEQEKAWIVEAYRHPDLRTC